MLGIEKFDNYPHVEILKDLNIDKKQLPKEIAMAIIAFETYQKDKPIDANNINKSVILADKIVNWYEKDFEEYVVDNSGLSKKEIKEEVEHIEDIKEVIDEHIQNIATINNSKLVGNLEEYISEHLSEGGKVHSDVLYRENIIVPTRPLVGSKEYTLGNYKVLRKAFDSYIYITKI